MNCCRSNRRSRSQHAALHHGSGMLSADRRCVLCTASLSSSTRRPAQRAPLADAAEKMDRPRVRALLKQRVDVNTPQVDGMTALHWATYQDDLEIAELLVRAGANVKAANRYGVTPLSLACTNGNGAMVELLLKAGADPNAALPGGETPLMTAARTGTLALGEGAPVPRRERRQQGRSARADGPDVGGGGRSRRRRGGAHRGRRGFPSPSAVRASRRCCLPCGKGASTSSAFC